MMTTSSPKSSQASSSSSSLFSCTTMLSNPSLDHRFQDEEQIYSHEENRPLLTTHDQHQAEYTFVSHGGSYDHHSTLMHESDKYGLKLPIRKRRVLTNNEDYYQSNCENNNTTTIENGSSKKWMSSKMRLMQKMMRNDRKRGGANNEMNKKLNSSSSNFDNPIRVCSDCNTTKTPLWRGGPSGPKSLCNACGIRQRKARRAMAEAASNGTILATTTTSFDHHVKTTVVVQQNYKKKRSHMLCVPSSSTSQKLAFEDFMLSLREKCSAFQRVFPQDEKEAAILLMALSHGLVL